MVLFSAALVLFVAAAFLIWSIVAQWQSRKPVRRFGLFEVSDEAAEAVTSLKNEIEDLQLKLDAGEEEITSLRERLSETQELADRFFALYETAVGAGDRDDD